MKFLKEHWRKISAGLVLCIVAAILIANNETQKVRDATVATKHNTITLTITGEVMRPGSHEVEYGTSLMDNLHLFGGFTMTADIRKIDVNAPLTEDTNISVKARASEPDLDFDSLYEMPE